MSIVAPNTVSINAQLTPAQVVAVQEFMQKHGIKLFTHGLSAYIEWLRARK